jgi:hypothetical protein
MKRTNSTVAFLDYPNNKTFADHGIQLITSSDVHHEVENGSPPVSRDIHSGRRPFRTFPA